MPWTKADAEKHNKKAKGKAGAKWAKVANAALEEYGDDATAVKVANAAIAKGKRKRGSK